MDKWIKYSLRGLIAFIGLVLIVWMVAYGYFRSHKEELLKKTTTELGNMVHGTVSIGDIGMSFITTFPNVSVTLDNVSIKDTLFEKHRHELLNVEELQLRTNPFKLITGKFEIVRLQLEKGSIYLYEDSTGYTSTSAFKTDDGHKKSSLRSSFKHIVLKDVNFTMSKPYKGKLFSFDIKSADLKLSENGDDIDIAAKTDLFVHSLSFRLEKGSFAEKQNISGEFDLTFNKTSKALSFDAITLDLAGEPFLFTGQFNFGGDLSYFLDIANKKTRFSKAVALLPISIRSNLDSIDIKERMPLDAHLMGFLIPGVKPKIRVNWRVNDSQITTPGGNFEHASFTGLYYNMLYDSLPGIPENAIIQFNKFSGNFEGVDIASKKISILNLKQPSLYCDIHANTNLENLNNVVPTETLEFESGTFNADIIYNGPIYDSATTAPRMYGNAFIKDAKLVYEPRQIKFENFNGDILFKNTDIFINNIKAVAGGNTVNINVAARNVLSMMNKDPALATLDAYIYSPKLNIGSFTNLVGSRSKTVSTRTKRRKASGVASKIDAILNECAISSHIVADNLIYNKFTASNFKTDILLTNEAWAIKNTSFNHAGGIVTMTGSIKSSNNNYNPISFNAALTNIDIAKTFYAFNNFGLSSLHAKNLRGRLTSTVDIHGALYDKAALIPASLKGKVKLSLKNGGIYNWAPLENMAIFLFKNRDFSQVDFSEIKNTFDIDGQKIKINRMEIASTILELYMEGLYDMGGKATDLTLQIPLSNLKKRKADYVPENKGPKNDPGASVYVIAKNKADGDIDFNFSLFAKKSDAKKTEAETDDTKKDKSLKSLPKRLFRH